LGRSLNLHLFPTISCQLFGIIQPATATCPSRTGQPFHHGRCETCNQRSQEQETSWARWHPPEILKNGGKPLLTVLFRMFTICWNRRCLPDDFRDTKIITLYKNKVDRRDCNNYRGISLLCIAGKVFARLLLPPESVRLLTEFYMTVNVAFAPLEAHQTWYFH